MIEEEMLQEPFDISQEESSLIWGGVTMRSSWLQSIIAFLLWECFRQYNLCASIFWNLQIAFNAIVLDNKELLKWKFLELTVRKYVPLSLLEHTD